MFKTIMSFTVAFQDSREPKHIHAGSIRLLYDMLTVPSFISSCVWFEEKFAQIGLF